MCLVYCRGLGSMTTPFRWRVGVTVRRNRELDERIEVSCGRARSNRTPVLKIRNRRGRDSRVIEASTCRVGGQRRDNRRNEVDTGDQVDR